MDKSVGGVGPHPYEGCLTEPQTTDHHRGVEGMNETTYIAQELNAAYAEDSTAEATTQRAPNCSGRQWQSRCTVLSASQTNNGVYHRSRAVDMERIAWEEDLAEILTSPGERQTQSLLVPSRSKAEAVHTHARTHTSSTHYNAKSKPNHVRIIPRRYITSCVIVFA